MMRIKPYTDESKRRRYMVQEQTLLIWSDVKSFEVRHKAQLYVNENSK